jgi:radical SAM superfamily enzyme YgiQ (UPF0313 family)
MNILLVYPMFPDTFWSFKHALKFISKKSGFPPLGLLTIASLMPSWCNKKLIDMNTSGLKDEDILWADYVFISAMSVQSRSADEVIRRCNNLNIKVAGGGPHFTSCFENYNNVDYLILNEAEITLPQFFNDLLAGNPKHIYTTEDWADITATPLPQWDLIPVNNYSSMNLQYSRGCPYNCDFCEITVLYGKKPRTKTKDQVIEELEKLYFTGWRGPVFFVDDNFIGNKAKLKKEILPAIAEWMEKRQNPFFLNTEASINLADDEELMHLMVQAGFEVVFIGIESSNEESLAECNKTQNRKRDLLLSIKKIQQSGLEVQGGFIVGFDHDPVSIFENLTEFIQESGIVTATVGLLNAPKGTELHKRMMKEGRLLKDFTGITTDFSMNFIPKMDPDILLKGYKNILNTIYSPKYYYARVTSFLKTFNPKKKEIFDIKLIYIKAFIKSIFKLGIAGKERFYYWKLIFWSLYNKPQLFSKAIQFSIFGFHFRKVSADV